MSFMEKYLGGHISMGPITIYGYNAMHFAINIWSKKLRKYICFHPTVKCYGRWWPWYFYISSNATPWGATYVFGPGVGREDKVRARIRRRGDKEFWATVDAVDRLKTERKWLEAAGW